MTPNMLLLRNEIIHIIKILICILITSLCLSLGIKVLQINVCVCVCLQFASSISSIILQMIQISSTQSQRIGYLHCEHTQINTQNYNYAIYFGFHQA